MLAVAPILASAGPAYAAAPTNDHLSKAIVVSAVPYRDARSTAGATTQSGERNTSCAKAKATVWYQLKLPQQTPISVSTYESGFDTTLAVWTGAKNLATMGFVQCNNDMGSRDDAIVGFVAEANTNYYVQVGGNTTSSTGALKLRITYGARADKADEIIGPQSTAATVAVAADDGGIDAGIRVREMACLGAFCFPIAEIRADSRLTPIPSTQAIRNCVLVIAVFFVTFQQCGPF